MTWTIYRLVDADHAPLYVGMTSNLPQRLDHHRRVRPWWADVAGVETVATCDRLGEAEAREASTIRREHPRHNVVHNDLARPRLNGVTLRVIRERSGFSGAELARAAGVEQSALSRLESGQRHGTFAQHVALARALDIPVGAISTAYTAVAA